MKYAIISLIFLLTACGGGEESSCSVDQQKLLERVDLVRGEKLIWSNKLEAAALMHATDLANTKRISHIGTDNSTVKERAKASGWDSDYVGENVAGGPGILNEQDAMKLWESSSGHLANIRYPGYTHVGVACVTSDRDYWVQVFGGKE